MKEMERAGARENNKLMACVQKNSITFMDYWI